jgi:hypothetical protein
MLSCLISMACMSQDPAMPNIGNDVGVRPLGMWRQVVTARRFQALRLLSQPPGSDFAPALTSIRRGDKQFQPHVYVHGQRL